MREKLAAGVSKMYAETNKKCLEGASPLTTISPKDQLCDLYTCRMGPDGKERFCLLFLDPLACKLPGMREQLVRKPLIQMLAGSPNELLVLFSGGVIKFFSHPRIIGFRGA